MKLVRCPGCGARFADIDGPVHRYMQSSQGCWHAFGQVLAREYANPALLDVHRLSVDSYAVQHPGGSSRQAVQSVGLHLARLCLFLEHGLSAQEANASMLRIGKLKQSMIYLTRPKSLGVVTVATVLAADSDQQHVERVNTWARSAWQAWAEHHATARHWASAAELR